MPRDWTGNSQAVYSTLAASNHSQTDREDYDYYATPPKAVEELLSREQFSKYIWECASGGGHIAEVLKKNGYDVKCTDIIDRGYEDTEIADFLTTERNVNDTSRDIITNPPYKCFSSDTECYTKSGWKNWQQLNKNDEVLSINPNTLKVEWSEINQIIHYEVNENMYHFKKSNMDILCTSDHRMFAYSKNGLVYKDNDLIHSQNIRTTHYIPRNGYSWEGNNAEYFILPAIDGFIYAQKVYKEPISILMQDWVRFFGMWLADGYCRHTNNLQGNCRKTVGIKQRKTNADNIRNILSKLPFKYKEYEDNNRMSPCINFEIHNDQLWSYLKQFGKSSDKFIPNEIKELNTDLLQILLDSYFEGDGSKYKSSKKDKVIGRIYRTTSKHLIEDLQEILLKMGYLAHITTQKYTTGDGVAMLYCITYSPNSIYNKIHYPSAKHSEVHYEGTVWCVNLRKNGVFLLRRNGKEFISGNCATEFVNHALEISDDGTKVAMFLKIQFLETKKRYELFKQYPPKKIYVFVNRVNCGKNGVFGKESSAVCYCWFVWEKGYKGKPTVDWIT